jgi:hypothetical protein
MKPMQYHNFAVETRVKGGSVLKAFQKAVSGREKRTRKALCAPPDDGRKITYITDSDQPVKLTVSFQKTTYRNELPDIVPIKNKID